MAEAAAVVGLVASIASLIDLSAKEVSEKIELVVLYEIALCDERMDQAMDCAAMLDKIPLSSLIHSPTVVPLLRCKDIFEAPWLLPRNLGGTFRIRFT